ncbi:MAG TPA: TetR/AcrR family transcriptional regulator [Flavobacteriaceae bacterium]|nr:TetR/AcrR family transcriptional regulator [Flavobacteriaceae bacterium]MCB9213792.1 TetR/AcrR family transcriptional regulator [Alteromonas sp.]HPF10866.1 TetR/AcrR family transcriptional regulator [Flavobacteriaceae bacterium]HQU22179.1 TetR/AcrR family transcriptional regulator [Flavobacteriaceae bacterium]HQU66513.1 TetR/AcrR family transcriptional regulator [Flavobacteriaceae bacterium]
MSITKADITTKYIIEKAAPIFNKKGYAATSMADITKATGLTKGAIYGNFENKDAIAIAAFNKSVNDLLKQIAQHQEQSNSPLQKLYLITDFYRNYYDYSKNLGGCPILNVGVNAHQQHTPLLNKVQEVIARTQRNVAKLVTWGQEVGEIKPEVDANKFARQLYTKIQGAVFMCHTMDDHQYLVDATQEIDSLITQELKSQ